MTHSTAERGSDALALCGAVIRNQLRNQSASVEQKLREADHKLRLREKELVDLQAG